MVEYSAPRRHPRIAAGVRADALARAQRELDAALVLRASAPIPAGGKIVSIPDEHNIVIHSTKGR